MFLLFTLHSLPKQIKSNLKNCDQLGKLYMYFTTRKSIVAFIQFPILDCFNS